MHNEMCMYMHITSLGRKTFGTCFGEMGLKIRPDVFRHNNWEQKKHVLLCKMSPASHFFLFEKGEKKYMKSVHSCCRTRSWGPGYIVGYII